MTRTRTSHLNTYGSWHTGKIGSWTLRQDLRPRTLGQDLGPRTLEQYPCPWTLDPAAPRTLDLPAGPRTPNSWIETAIDNLFDLFCCNNFEINFYKYYLFCICFSMILLIQFKLMRRLLKQISCSMFLKSCV